jgi:hypothetical protein
VVEASADVTGGEPESLRDRVGQFARVLVGLHQGDVEHVVGVFVAEWEALAIHVAHDGSAWYGMATDSGHLRELLGVTEGLPRGGEAKPAGRSSALERPRSAPERQTAQILALLARPAALRSSALLVRMLGDRPRWLVGRQDAAGISGSMLGADALVAELVRIDEFTHRPCDGRSMGKPSLRAFDTRPRR